VKINGQTSSPYTDILENSSSSTVGFISPDSEGPIYSADTIMDYDKPEVATPSMFPLRGHQSPEPDVETLHVFEASRQPEERRERRGESLW
jgi:hypothetical protein